MNELTGTLPSHLTARPEAAVQDKTSMGKDDFMKLLMAQLQHQDPLNPMDHKEFGAQLAQFASLEKLTQIGDGIHKLEGGMGEDAKLQALGMIGKRVKANSAEVALIENQPVDIQLNRENGFKPLKVSIFSGDGKFVRELDVDPKDEGKKVTWDGKDKDGMALVAGKYLFRVAGAGPDGKSKEMDANLSGKVIGVEMAGNMPMLLVDTANGQVKIELAKVQNIGTDEGEKKAEPKAVTQSKTVAAAVAPEPKSIEIDSRWPGLGFSDAAGVMGGRP